MVEGEYICLRSVGRSKHGLRSQNQSVTFVSKRLSEKFGKLWLAAEVLLFVLVGAAVDIRYTLNAGIAAILMIFLALFSVPAGVCSFV